MNINIDNDIIIFLIIKQQELTCFQTVLIEQK